MSVCICARPTGNDYRCDINASDIKQAASALQHFNLTSKGYTYCVHCPNLLADLILGGPRRVD